MYNANCDCMVNYCPTCGKEIEYKEAEICPNCGVRIPNQVSTERAPYAGFLIRLVAALIDSIIVFIPVCIIEFLLTSMFFVHHFERGFHPPFFPMGIPMIIIGIIIGWIYYAVQESSTYQATLGKRAVGVKVVNESFEQITLSQATVRFIIKEIPILNLISYIVLIVDEKKQGLHDKAARTFVVYREN